MACLRPLSLVSGRSSVAKAIVCAEGIMTRTADRTSLSISRSRSSTVVLSSRSLWSMQLTSAVVAPSTACISLNWTWRDITCLALWAISSNNVAAEFECASRASSKSSTVFGRLSYELQVNSTAFASASKYARLAELLVEVFQVGTGVR